MKHQYDPDGAPFLRDYLLIDISSRLSHNNLFQLIDYICLVEGKVMH